MFKKFISIILAFIVGLSILIERLYCVNRYSSVIYYILVAIYGGINSLWVDTDMIKEFKLVKLCSVAWFLGLIIGECIYVFKYL